MAKGNNGGGLTLLAGGAGLVGPHLSDLLRRQGYGVRILDSLEPNTQRNGKPPRIPAEAASLHADVRGYFAEVGKLLSEKHIVHRAAGNVRPA